jgi:hypothetical protein
MFNRSIDAGDRVARRSCAITAVGKEILSVSIYDHGPRFAFRVIALL